MNTFFTCQSYRELIKSSLEQGKLFDPTLTAQRLAEAVGIQKSYLSKVLNERADFNSDQLYLIGDFFQWTEEQMKFALLLLEFDRSSVQTRKKLLREEIEKIQHKHVQIKEVISAPSLDSHQEFFHEYYLNPWVQIVHIGLSIPRYATNIQLLAEDLHLPESMVGEAVKLLLKRNILREINGKGLEIIIQQIHLSKDSLVFKAWQTQIRLIALQRLQSAPQKTDYSFNVVFSADEPTRKKLQAEILALLKKAEAQVQDAAEKDIFFLGLDYFQWTS